MHTFVAIDFETATAWRDSACAVGVAAGCGGRVVHSCTYLIRPPRPQFTFTGIHGLRWEHVCEAPTFAELWPALRGWIDDAAFVAAHNAAFDRSVLHACCARYGLHPPRARFICTVQLARSQWGIRPTKLPNVCRRLSIPLHHHDARADAEACARIVLAAEAEGWRQRGSGRAGRRRRIEAPTDMGQDRNGPLSRALQIREAGRLDQEHTPRLRLRVMAAVKAAASLLRRYLLHRSTYSH